MKKKILFLVAVFAFALASFAQQSQSKPDTKWFEDARFGLFVHFGPYSVLGHGEWVLNNESIKVEDYKQLQDIFNPQGFDAHEWVSMAKAAGMKYITFTTRHHDSFSNWATKQSDWNIMNTPYGKDLVKQLADECHKQGIKLVLYYSLLDWSRPEYQHETSNTLASQHRMGKSDWNAYIKFMKSQLTELLTQYGDIAGIWFDGDWDQVDSKTGKEKVDWHYPEIYALIHKLQPQCLVANNNHRAIQPGEDYQLFERDLPGDHTSGFNQGQTVANHVPLETCETLGSAWGFNIKDDQFKTPTQVVRLLVKTAGLGANLLLNVGPLPNGKFQPQCVDILKQVGKWMDQYGYTVYGTTKGCIAPQKWGASTQKGKTLYIHIFDSTTKELTLTLPPFKKACWVNTPDVKLKWKKNKKTKEITFDTSGLLSTTIDSIIEVTLK